MEDRKPFFGSTLSKWLIAGAAIVTIGVGVGIADWARGGPGWYGHGSHGQGWHGQDWDGQRGYRHGMTGGPRMARLCERDPLKFEGVARAFIKADLDLTPAQNAELDKLAAGLVPALKALRDEVCNDFAQRGGATAPERLEKFASVLRKAADTAEKTVAPAKNFYATLDDKQKQRVEELANRHHRRHGMPPGGMMGPGGGPGGRAP